MADIIDPNRVGIAAINLGFGYTKLSLDGAEDIFMSVLSPHLRSAALAGNGKPPNLLNIVGSPEEEFEVGLDAATASWTDPLRVLSSEWARSRQYRLLGQAVLNRMANTGKKRWRIITGLAADHFQDPAYRIDVANFWRGSNGVHQTAFGAVEILTVSVVPETVGGFTSLFANPAIRSQMQTFEGAVVDFGTMTTNWLPFKGGEPQADGFQSIDVGVFNVMDAATKSVRRRVFPSARSVDLESAYLGIRALHAARKNAAGMLVSLPIDVDAEVQSAARKVWPQIEAALRTNLGDFRGKLLYGIGGGTKVFGNLLQTAFSESVCQFSPSSQMENVRGLYLLAKSKTLSQP